MYGKIYDKMGRSNVQARNYFNILGMPYNNWV